MEYFGKDKIVHVQSVLLKEDVDALKKKTHETSIKDAISKAVYHYLKCDQEPEELLEVKTKKERY